MRYLQYLTCDTVNGPGIRCSLWVAGCTINCKGCFSPPSHNFDAGDLYTGEVEVQILKDLGQSHISGLSILGGHMFEAPNFKRCLDLIRSASLLVPRKSIYVWTGHTLDRIQAHPQYHKALDFIDVLIDGPFVESKKVAGQLYGSGNQRILHRGKDF